MPAPPINYAVYVSAPVALAPSAGIHLPDGQPAQWSPLSSTLIYGPTEAVLTDPPITIKQAKRLADWVASFDRQLTAIYITHGHGDHWFGTQTLLERLPTVNVYATAGVINEMKQGTVDGRPSPFWQMSFPDQIGDTPVLAQPMPLAGLEVDGHLLHAVEVGHTDSPHTTVLHIPSIGLLVAGDAVYNHVHQWLAESAEGGLTAWLHALDVVESLAPTHIVAGHKNATRNDAPSSIAETRTYLQAAAEVLMQQPTRRAYFDHMLAQFPHHLNPTIAWLSAMGRIPELPR